MTLPAKSDKTSVVEAEPHTSATPNPFGAKSRPVVSNPLGGANSTIEQLLQRVKEMTESGPTSQSKNVPPETGFLSHWLSELIVGIDKWIEGQSREIEFQKLRWRLNQHLLQEMPTEQIELRLEIVRQQLQQDLYRFSSKVKA